MEEFAVFPIIKRHTVIVFLSVLVLAVVVCTGVVSFCMRNLTQVQHDMLLLRKQHLVLHKIVAALPPPLETANVTAFTTNRFEGFAENMTSTIIGEVAEWLPTSTDITVFVRENRSSLCSLLDGLVSADDLHNQTL